MRVLGKVGIYEAVGWGLGDFWWPDGPSHPPIGWDQIWISSRNENCQKQIERDRLYLMSRYWRCQKSISMPPQLVSRCTLHPNRAIGSTQWSNPIEPRILKYSIKIIRNVTLQNLLAYTEPYASVPAPDKMPIFGSWDGSLSWTYCSVRIQCGWYQKNYLCRFYFKLIEPTFFK